MRCSGQLPLPSMLWALLLTGAGRAAMVPGTSYLGNVRNAPRRGFFLGCEPNVPGAETPHPACPASCRQSCPPAPGWLPVCVPGSSILGAPGASLLQKGGTVSPSLKGVWGAGCQAWGRKVPQQTGWRWQDVAVPGARCWAGWQQVLGLRHPLLLTQVCTHPAGDLASWHGASQAGFGGELGPWAGAQGCGPASGHRSWQCSLCQCRSLRCLGVVQVAAGASEVPG